MLDKFLSFQLGGAKLVEPNSFESVIFEATIVMFICRHQLDFAVETVHICFLISFSCLSNLSLHDKH